MNRRKCMTLNNNKYKSCEKSPLCKITCHSALIQFIIYTNCHKALIQTSREGRKVLKMYGKIRKK